MPKQKRYRPGQYQKNRDTIIRGARRAHLRRAENKALFKAKLGGKCVDCGLEETEILQFDHVDPKKKHFEISTIMGRTDLYAIWEEVKKCQLRCPNCHVRRTLAQKRAKRKPENWPTVLEQHPPMVAPALIGPDDPPKVIPILEQPNYVYKGAAPDTFYAVSDAFYRTFAEQPLSGENTKIEPNPLKKLEL